MERQAKSILEMARGAFLERADYEMRRLVDNILDANTNPTAKRKMTITMTLEPDSDRKNVIVKFEAKSSLAATNPIRTTLYIAGESSDGVPQILEMTPQVPGQLDMFGGIQEPQAMLRMLQTSNIEEDSEKLMHVR
ncbi:hypothetical protein AGMMS49957_01960 [Synergistales bacterium]|nr:hypothetical protein AGMMS49957_01960 [Synergistales bacterium]